MKEFKHKITKRSLVRDLTPEWRKYQLKKLDSKQTDLFLVGILESHRDEFIRIYNSMIKATCFDNRKQLDETSRLLHYTLVNRLAEVMSDDDCRTMFEYHMSTQKIKVDNRRYLK